MIHPDRESCVRYFEEGVRETDFAFVHVLSMLKLLCSNEQVHASSDVGRLLDGASFGPADTELSKAAKGLMRRVSVPSTRAENQIATDSLKGQKRRDLRFALERTATGVTGRAHLAGPCASGSHLDCRFKIQMLNGRGAIYFILRILAY